MADPSVGKMTSMHFYAWKNGLKTGMYYLRSRPAADAIKFTVDAENLLEKSGFGAKNASAFIGEENMDTLNMEEINAWRAKIGYSDADEEEVCISCSG